MNNITLVIPAKNEKESLPKVLDELKIYNLEILVVLEKDDKETIQSAKNYNCKILYQNGKGYGDALITGINAVETEFFCVFNADGSFDPSELNKMFDQINDKNVDFVFGTRYEKNCGSDDDTIITLIGNFIFTKIGILFFMEMTLEEALRRGVEAHQRGDIQEAERFYTAILSADPRHSDANHNMGVEQEFLRSYPAAILSYKKAVNFAEKNLGAEDGIT
mgnify:CR=1 FL=1